MHHSCKCPSPLEEMSDHQCSPDYSQFSLESCNCCCCQCDKTRKPLVKGKFGLAYVVETPKKKFCKPLGWQVEFEDTPSRIANNCKKMMKWVNCPPLGDCNNRETNFCAYPDKCGKMFQENIRQCECCPPKTLKPCDCIQDDVKFCYVKKAKKKSRSPCRESEHCSSSPNCERVCIICENCKINASGCCNPPKVSCLCDKKTLLKNLKCSCDCKCVLEKDDSTAKCSKCCRSKCANFFRDCSDQCCTKNKKHNLKKNHHPSDESLDYVPKKENRLKNRSPDRKKDSTRDRSLSPKIKHQERSLSPKNTQNKEALSRNTYTVEKLPVSKENKGTKMDVSDDMFSRKVQSEPSGPKQIDTKPVTSSNLIDELQDRLKERKEKDNEIAPDPNAKEETANTNKPIESANENNLTASTNNDEDYSSETKSVHEDMTEQSKTLPNENNNIFKEDEAGKTIPHVLDYSFENVLTNVEANDKKPILDSREPVIHSKEKLNSDNKPPEQKKEEKEKIPLLQRIKRAHQKQMDEIHHNVK